MITESSNNTDIFIFSTILSLLFDLYFLIFLPFFWIYTSWGANWAGWTNGRRRRRVFYWTRPTFLSPDIRGGCDDAQGGVDKETGSEESVDDESDIEVILA